MTALVVEVAIARATSVSITEDELTLELADGRTLSVPIAWSPRLAHGAHEERENWEFIADGEGIHWPDLDEDIKVSHLLEGRKSAESPKSFQRWLEAKKAGRSLTLDALMEYERSQDKDK